MNYSNLQQSSRLDWLIQSYHQQTGASKQRVESNEQQQYSTDDVVQSNDQQTGISKGEVYTNQQQTYPPIDSVPSTLLLQMGTNTKLHSETQQTETPAQNTQPEEQQTTAATETISSAKTLPGTIEINNLNIGKLTGALEKVFSSKAKRSTAKNAASMLLSLHNNHHATRDELRKVSGMSVGGFAKRFSAVCKLGWIARQSYQKYALTPAGIALLQRVFGQ